MSHLLDRRDFLALMGVGGLVFASGLPGCAGAAPPPAGPRREDFFFLQLSDTHWGFRGPANPEADVILERAVATINATDARPDFVVFTGDLTHVTDDPVVRRERMKRFRELVSSLNVEHVRFLPGEHDAAADRGEAYREVFGEPTYAFDHKGVRFLSLDNASLPGGALGDTQIAWLQAELVRLPSDAPLVVLAHRPLFPLFTDWEWATRDGARAIELLAPRAATTVFYGHIHQEHHFVTGRVAHHAARSLVFPLPAPGSVGKKAPLPWDPGSRDHGLGWRAVAPGAPSPRITEARYESTPRPAARSSVQPAQPAVARCDAPAPDYATEVRPILERRCFACHTGDGPAAEVHDLAHVDGARALQRRRLGEAVAARAMPPPGRPPLAAAEAETLLRWAICREP